MPGWKKVHFESEIPLQNFFNLMDRSYTVQAEILGFILTLSDRFSFSLLFLCETGWGSRPYRPCICLALERTGLRVLLF